MFWAIGQWQNYSRNKEVSSTIAAGDIQQASEMELETLRGECKSLEAQAASLEESEAAAQSRLCAALLQKDALEQSSATLTHNLLHHEKSESEALRCEQEVAEGLRCQWEQLQKNHVLTEDQFEQALERCSESKKHLENSEESCVRLE
jgi:hypothetical protein